jgi:nicotinate phosphoribosyltransferase
MDIILAQDFLLSTLKKQLQKRMIMLNQVYKTSFSLLTDLYQLTMGYGYWKAGMADQNAVFNLFFRKNPFQGGYAIAAGLQQVVELIQQSRFTDEDISYLRSLTGNDGKPLFEEGYLQYLANLEYDIDIDAVPEGSVVFPHEPIIRVRGPIIPCQLLETPLLTCINFQTLIATKSSRISHIANNDLVLEFGLRRAQGFDGGLSASRAAYIGGIDATSNVLAGKLLDIPVKGTHAHAWVMMFPNETEAFSTYAAAMPNNCVFLVDTYDTIGGIKFAIEQGKKLRKIGHEMVGIRLDSGDMAELSIAGRQLLNQEGFPQAKIIASDSLDERKIYELKQRGAQIDIWGVGTNLVTAKDQPALGGVYKLSCVESKTGIWEDKVKLSNTPIKVSNPGILQIRRFRNITGKFEADMIYDERRPLSNAPTLRPFSKETSQRVFNEGFVYEDLLKPILKSGRLIWSPPSIHQIRQRTKDQLKFLSKRYQQLEVNEQYCVGLEESVYSQKMKLISERR